MLGGFVTSVLKLLLGYIYPAFECFREIERSRPEIEKLRFWCQYWIIIGFATGLERFADMFISWLPLYGEAKLAFIIYLWHPRTRGTWYVYNRFVMPRLAEHEPYISAWLQELRTKSGNLLRVCLRSVSGSGPSLFFDLLQYVVIRGSPQGEDGGAPPAANRPRPPPPPPPLPSRRRPAN